MLLETSAPQQIRPSTSVLAALVTAVLLATPASAFQPGERVKLTRDEPLNFTDHKLRDGKAGEEFSVLADQAALKKVFVSTTDTSGRQIAVWAPADAFVVVPLDMAKVRADAIAAAKAGKFADATQVLARAITSSPKDPDLLRLRDSLSAVQNASKLLATAKDNVKRASQTAAQKRKNAATVDRPNPLNPGDTSNQARAAKMKEEADQMEAAAKVAMAEAEGRWKTSLASLDSGQPSGGSTAISPPDRITVQPGIELSESQRAQMAKQETSDAAAAQRTDALFAKLWSQQPVNADRFVEPRLPTSGGAPSYADTLEFINGKLGGFATMGFGEKTRKMILRFTPGETAVFDPADLNQEVRYGKRTVTYGPDSREEGYVLLQVRNSAPKIEVHQPIQEANGALDPQVVTSSDLKVGQLGNLNPLDAEKLATAFAHLIGMFGGKKEAF